MGIHLKDNKGIKNRVNNCFINNKYIYIKTNQNRYETLKPDLINSSLYKKETKLNIKLNDNEYIESIFSMILPENN